MKSPSMEFLQDDQPMNPLDDGCEDVVDEEKAEDDAEVLSDGSEPGDGCLVCGAEPQVFFPEDPSRFDVSGLVSILVHSEDPGEGMGGEVLDHSSMGQEVFCLDHVLPCIDAGVAREVDVPDELGFDDGVVIPVVASRCGSASQLRRHGDPFPLDVFKLGWKLGAAWNGDTRC